MKVKRYIGNDINEAMIKIKNELGVDAVILNTRKIKRPGLLGSFKPKLVEVVAAVDEKEPVHIPIQPKAKADEPDPRAGEIAELREMINQIVAKIESKENVAPAQGPTDGKLAPNVMPNDAERTYLKIMTDGGVRENIALKVLDIIKRQINLEKSSPENVAGAIRVILREYLGKPAVIDEIKEGRRTCLFVGPTGVGKTTTLAKLAARLSLIDNKKVGLITADTYRIAAVEQLKTYSEILGIPLTVVYEPDELKEAIKSYADRDFILVDTAGRSHKSKELREDIEGILRYMENPEIYLVLSLTTGYKDLISILESYRFLDEYRLIFTKLDEASSLANIVNIKVLTGRPLSYFTTGQSVPDDIEVASPDKVIADIVGEAR